MASGLAKAYNYSRKVLFCGSLARQVHAGALEVLLTVVPGRRSAMRISREFTRLWRRSPFHIKATVFQLTGMRNSFNLAAFSLAIARRQLSRLGLLWAHYGMVGLRQAPCACPPSLKATVRLRFGPPQVDSPTHNDMTSVTSTAVQALDSDSGKRVEVNGLLYRGFADPPVPSLSIPDVLSGKAPYQHIPFLRQVYFWIRAVYVMFVVEFPPLWGILLHGSRNDRADVEGESFLSIHNSAWPSHDFHRARLCGRCTRQTNCRRQGSDRFARGYGG